MACWGGGQFLTMTCIPFTIPFADPKCPSRYHCTHEAGVHSVGLTWIHKLHKFLGSGEFSGFSGVFHRFCQEGVWNRKIIEKVDETKRLSFENIKMDRRTFGESNPDRRLSPAEKERGDTTTDLTEVVRGCDRTVSCSAPHRSPTRDGHVPRRTQTTEMGSKPGTLEQTCN